MDKKQLRIYYIIKHISKNLKIFKTILLEVHIYNKIHK